MKMKIINLGPNHIKIIDKKGVFLQSYNSIIVFVPNKGKIELGKNWKYSATTSKYRSKFLDETTKETQKKLNNNEYILNKKL